MHRIRQTASYCPVDAKRMIRIVSRRCRPSAATQRDLPAGSKRLIEADLGFACYERISATSGSFASTYGQFAIVLTDRASTGPVRLNAGSMQTLPERTQSLNFFRPGDHVEGVWEAANTYDVLLFAPRHLETFVEQELESRTSELPPLLRIEPDLSLKWLWRQLTKVVGRPEDTARMQAETIGNLIITVIAANERLLKPASGGASTAEIAQAMSFIHENLAGHLTVSDLASAAGLSKFHFCRVFKLATGYPVHQYVVEQRLLHAREMLETTSQPISQIALESGFASQSHLNSSFKRRFGVTPRVWRASARTTASLARPLRRPSDA